MLIRTIATFLLLIAGCSSGFSQNPTLMLPVGHSHGILHASFSPDGKKILTVGSEGVAKLWETGTGKLLKDFKASGDGSITMVTKAEFVAGGKKILVTYEAGSNEVLLYDIATGNEWDIWNRGLTADQFSPDGKRMVISDDFLGDTMYSVDTYKALMPLKKNNAKTLYTYTPDGKKFFSASSEPNEKDESLATVRAWDAITGKPLTGYKKFTDAVYSIHASPDSKKILLSCDHSGLIIDANSLALISSLKGYKSQQGIGENVIGDETIQFSPDGKRLIQRASTFYDNGNQEFSLSFTMYDSLIVWDIQTGKVLYSLSGLQQQPGFSSFSPDGKKIIFTDTSHVVKIGDAASGKVLFELSGHTKEVLKAFFGPDGKTIISASADNTVKLWDAATGKLLKEFKGHTGAVNDVRFSTDAKRIVTASADRSAIVWDISTGKELTTIKGRTNDIVDARFDPDGKSVDLRYENYNLIWDIYNGRLSPTTKDTTTGEVLNYDLSPDSMFVAAVSADFLFLSHYATDNYLIYGTGLTGEREIYKLVRYSPDGKRLLIITEKNIAKLFDIKTKKLVLSFVAIDSANFLVSDPKSHYDGTEAARKLIHFTCGEEVIELDQVKDQLWVPDLAGRIINGDSINAATLDELNICKLTPLLEQGNSATEYYFKIKPRRGGIGKTVISVNGIEFNSYSPTELKKAGAAYEIRIPRDQLKAFFAENQENIITVRSQTADNSTSSRTLSIIEDPDKEKRAPPKLFGVMVGVSNYKGENMDLEYAAIDAADISSTVGDAAKKLLGNDHVFMYNLTTDSGHIFPEKRSIKRTFDDIAARAGPNDILFIFLSGHGVMQDKTKQFYYMTADASSLTDENMFKDVGVSMTELTDWIKPQNIKAQKRILILDACKSGQAINDMMPDRRLLAVKGDGNAQQVKAIDKLNERSGLFILSASASSQLAFESGIYSHGYLTYSLLKAIKEKPDILEDGKYLNVSRWFNTAAQTVSEMAKQDRAKQEPQIVTNTDFNVGLVDNEVIAKINLSETKTLFTSGNFLNSSIIDDDLGLRKLIDNRLDDIARTETEKKIVFLPSTGSSEAYSLTGGYSVKEKEITIKVNLKKDNAIKQQFEMKGATDKLNDLADAIIAKAIEWIEEDK